MPDVLTLDEWKKQTSAGSFAVRDKNLQCVDNRIAEYHKSTAAKKRGALSNLTAAFDQYKFEHPQWRNEPRNEQGALSRMTSVLEYLATQLNGYMNSTPIPREALENWRKGVTYVMANLSVEGHTQLSWNNIKNTKTMVSDGKSAVDDLVSAARSPKFPVDAVPDTGVVAQLTEAVKAFLLKVAGPVTDALKHLIEIIVAGIPEVLKNIASAISSVGLTPAKIASSLYTAISSGVLHYKTASLSKSVHIGSTRDIVESIRSQTMGKVKVAIKDMATTALKGAVSLAPFGALVTAIIGVLEYVAGLYEHYKERIVVSDILKLACERHHGGIYKDAGEFNSWFKEQIEKSPLLASYMISLPLTGSYYGFLNLFYDDGTEISSDLLRLNYNNIYGLKEAAAGYIRESKIRLVAAEGNKLLQHSLDCAYQRNGMNATLLQRGVFYLSNCR